MTPQQNLQLANIKAILIDVDGTMTRSDRTVSPVVEEKIREARDRGLIVSLCTGRHAPALTTIFGHLGFEGIHVVAGGAEVIQAGQPHQILWSKYIDDQTSQWLYKNVKDLGGEFILGKPEALYGYEEFIDAISEHPWDIPVKNLNELEDWTTPLISVHKLNAQLEEFITSQDKVHFVKMMSPSNGPYMDLTAHGVSKLVGVQKWAEKLGLTLDQIMGIGDGGNDAEYLGEIGLPVAVANAAENVLALSDVHVASNDEDGVAEAIDLLLAR